MSYRRSGQEVEPSTAGASGGRDLECGAHLMEADWQEGFTCSLPKCHSGPHRDEGGIQAVNESTDEAGRRYTWVHEWSWRS